MPLRHLQTPDFITESPLIAVGIGAALLCAGRKLFWLFVGAVGFAFAMRVASEYVGNEHRRELFVACVIAGVIGAVLAIFVQKIAVAVAGALTGAYLLDHFFSHGLGHYPELGWIFVVAAAVLGAFLMIVVFDWTLIFLTSLAGAHLILREAPLQPKLAFFGFLVLVAIGVAIQARRSARPAN